MFWCEILVHKYPKCRVSKSSKKVNWKNTPVKMWQQKYTHNIFLSVFFSRTFRNHMAAGKGGDYFFSCSLPPLTALPTFKHYQGNYCCSPESLSYTFFMHNFWLLSYFNLAQLCVQLQTPSSSKRLCHWYGKHTIVGKYFHGRNTYTFFL